MEYIRDLTRLQQGVGATAEARLTPLQPLIEYYEREMGELPGRLMIATSFLGDVQLMSGWSELSPEFRQAVEQAQALVVSAMVRILNAQDGEGCGCNDDDGSTDELQRFLDSLPRRE
ncbi:MAG: hypothetical protein NVS3B14_03300 [Ktedonobacteraceae bacterium]